jgi:hypothetical protein
MSQWEMCTVVTKSCVISNVLSCTSLTVRRENLSRVQLELPVGRSLRPEIALFNS